MAYALRPWWKDSSTTTLYIQLGKTCRTALLNRSNPVRRNVLNTGLYALVAETQGLANHGRWESNELRSHSSLQGLKPLEA